MIKPITISVIVPVYNSEHMLCRMVDSLLLQTMDAYEIILIDDGSTDSSGVICDQYAEQQANVRVVHKKNEGVSAARQTGLDAAQGEYVIHADSDDWVEPTMLEELYRKAQEEDADVVICDFYVNQDGYQTYSKQQPTVCEPESMLRDLFQQLHGSCWNKLVRRDSLNKYHIRFPKGINHCEDLLTWVQLLQHPEIKISYLPYAYYHYCVNDESITRNYTHATYEMRQRFQKRLVEMLPSSGFEKEIEQSAFSIFTEAFIYGVLSESEIAMGLRDYRDQIKGLKSLKWRVGFFFLQHHCLWFAHQLIHY